MYFMHLLHTFFLFLKIFLGYLEIFLKYLNIYKYLNKWCVCEIFFQLLHICKTFCNVFIKKNVCISVPMQFNPCCWRVNYVVSLNCSISKCIVNFLNIFDAFIIRNHIDSEILLMDFYRRWYRISFFHVNRRSQFTLYKTL